MSLGPTEPRSDTTQNLCGRPPASDDRLGFDRASGGLDPVAIRSTMGFPWLRVSFSMREYSGPRALGGGRPNDTDDNPDGRPVSRRTPTVSTPAVSQFSSSVMQDGILGAEREPGRSVGCPIMDSEEA
jgi:hypothetical protein